MISKITSEPKVFNVDDGRHMAALYQFQPPLTPDDITLNLDQMISSGMDTLIYIAGLVGGSVLYDSKVTQKIGDNVNKWVHPVYYRTSRNLQRLVSDGYDPLKLLCDRANENGLWFLASAWNTVTGGVREPYIWEGGNSDFAFDNPHLQVGEDKDPRSEHTDSTRFNFLHTEVREERFILFKEMLSAYETDGIVLNFTELVPLCKFSEVNSLSSVLTQWISRLRNVASKAESDQNRRKMIYAKVPSHPDACSMLGIEIKKWVSSKLVDGLICQSSLMPNPMDQHCDLKWIKSVVSNSNCRILVGTSMEIGRHFSRVATPQMINATAANAYAEGADGFGFISGGSLINGWPWSGSTYETIRVFGNPDLLSTSDKIYRARSIAKHPNTPNFSRYPQDGPTDWTPGSGIILPITLSEGKPVEIPIVVSENLQKRNKEERVEKVELKVRISGLEPDLNDISIQLNNHILPKEFLQLEDLTFRYMNGDLVAPYGFVYRYGLTPKYYPEIGRNFITITLKKRDPNIEPPFQIYDIDLTIKYKPHRNFNSDGLNY